MDPADRRQLYYRGVKLLRGAECLALRRSLLWGEMV